MPEQSHSAVFPKLSAQALYRAWPPLLQSVFIGNYVAFRRFLKDQGIQSLDLTQRLMKCEPSELAHLGKALQGTSVSTLNLFGNRLQSAALLALVNALPDTNITTLDLGFNYLDRSGAGALGVALSKTLVHTLNLRLNRLSGVAISGLAKNAFHSKLTCLDLSFNKLGVIGAVILTEALVGSHIRQLCLNGNELTSAVIIALAKNLPYTIINNLELKNNKIEDIAAFTLLNNLCHTQVIQLSMVGNHINRALINQLDNAIVRQRHTLIMGPYYAACLPLLPSAKQVSHFGLKQADLADETGRLRYAGGILMQLPVPILCHTLGYLPLMKTKTGKNQALSYWKLANKNALQKSDSKDIKTDKNDAYYLK